MSVLNRKMFNRGARKELRKKGGIEDVQYFQTAGRVDVSNISNQDAIIGGLLFAKHAFLLVDKKIKFVAKKKDGSSFKLNIKTYFKFSY